MSDAFDAQMASVSADVAARLGELSRSGESVGERSHLQPVGTEAMSARLGGPVASRRLAVPNWQPVPGAVDAVFRSPGRPRITAEFKLQKVDETLWDAYKMIDTTLVKGVEAAFLLVGAADGQWDAEFKSCTRGARAGALFGAGTTEHISAELFDACAHAWYGLLWGGTGRPVRVPPRIRTIRVADEPLAIDGKGGRLRCVRVEPADSGWLEFSLNWHSGEWPLGVEPCEHYLKWRESHPV